MMLRRFGLQEGEGRRTILMFSYVFLIIASLLVVKPVRNSLFLTAFGPQQLPYAFILAALVSALVASLYARLASRFALDRLISVWLVFSTLCRMDERIVSLRGAIATKQSLWVPSNNEIASLRSQRQKKKRLKGNRYSCSLGL